MSITRYYFSRRGLRRYEAMVARQKKEAKSLARTIGESAGPSCDWHDNFAFEDARRRTEMEMNRLREMRRILQHAEIIEPLEQDDFVRIGNTLVARDNEGNETKVTIGAFGESEPKRGIVSYQSPLGKSLLGKEVGDVAVIATGRRRELSIEHIYPPSHAYWSILDALDASQE